VSQYQKGKTNLDFTEARNSEWQWHELGRMQVCTSLQTDDHASTPLVFFTGRMPFLPPNQQRQNTEGKYFFHQYFSAITVKNIYESFTHKMATKASWHRNYVTVTLCMYIHISASLDS